MAHHAYAKNAKIGPEGLLSEKDKKRNKRQPKCKSLDGGRGRTLSPALGIESSESGCVPWVWLESVVRRVSQTVCSAGQDLIDNEGTLPFGLELVLFLVRQA